MLLFILWTFVPHSVKGRGPHWLRNSETGAALTYHAIRQARSWFGYSDGYGNDHVRSESLYLFLRRTSRFLFVDIGTAQMWVNVNSFFIGVQARRLR
jgi:hypothetical protein